MSIVACFQKILGVMLFPLALFLVFACSFEGTEARAQAVSATEGKAFLVVTGVPGTTVSRLVGDQMDQVVFSGTLGEDGTWISPEGVAAGTYTFIFDHKNAAEPLRMDGVVLSPGLVKKLEPQLKMRVGELTVVCVPADVEIFLDGVHKGRGVLVQGNLPLGKEILVEARSGKFGTQAKRVKVTDESSRVKFDMRGNTPAEKPDGKIVLPDVPLVLAIQPSAIVKVNGAQAKLENGALVELPLGECVVEIFLPLKDREIKVWSGAFFAHTAVLPIANRVAVAFPVKEKIADKPAGVTMPSMISEKEKPVATSSAASASAFPPAKVSMVLASRFMISIGAKSGLAEGGFYNFRFAGRDKPIAVRLSGVSTDSALAEPENLPADQMPKEGEQFTIEISNNKKN